MQQLCRSGRSVWKSFLIRAFWLLFFFQLNSVHGDPAFGIKKFSGIYTGPYFDPTIPTNITTQLGTHAYLPCKVRQLDNKSVSWIRKRDGHIITIGKDRFISDDRFQAYLAKPEETWTLQIKYVQARDAGEYECQVSTEPKMSHFITLNVIVPKTDILGESDIFVKTGSTVQMTCIITQCLEDPAYVSWFHDDVPLPMSNKDVPNIVKVREQPDTTISTLKIYPTVVEDSGNYTCSPSNLESASVVLHVLDGEYPAAMQRDKNSASRNTICNNLFVCFGLPIFRSQIIVIIIGILVVLFNSS